MKIAIVTGSILLALASSAAAQPGLTPPGTVPEAAPAPDPVGEPLSPGTALTLSLGGTLGSWGLLFGSGLAGSDGAGALLGTAGAVGIFVGPSFGHWYADKYFTRGLALRLLGGVTLVAGAFVALAEDPISFGHDDPEPTNEEPVVGPAIAIVGAALFVYGTIDDIVTAPRRARQVNQARGLALAPMVAPGTTGLALAGRF